MKRLLLACSVVFAFGAMCTGAVTTEDDGTDGDETDKEVVIVPVPTSGDDENWCCQYVDEDGAKRFALVDGPTECNSDFADMDGRWVSGTQCTPCCCKSDGDVELTTPGECAGVGECVSAEGHRECEAAQDDEEDDDPPIRKGPRPGSSSGGGAVRRDPGANKPKPPEPGKGGKGGKGGK